MIILILQKRTILLGFKELSERCFSSFFAWIDLRDGEHYLLLSLFHFLSPSFSLSLSLSHTQAHTHTHTWNLLTTSSISTTTVSYAFCTEKKALRDLAFKTLKKCEVSCDYTCVLGKCIYIFLSNACNVVSLSRNAYLIKNSM